ncbi:TPA: hypothetical protein DEP58_01285 [Patescibacteria group bacterium]|nr:MAG: hypothetical protein UU98_C0035G0007 [Parcubacteria group bacterium GW2011_GWD2_42_14]HCC04922.1 hypothetical protein [Patescibacteria group bacterium]
MNPKVQLIVDVKKDIENAQWFVQDGEFVEWFLPKDFQYILSKKFSTPEKNKIITEYTKYVHTEKQKDIQKGVEQVKEQWAKTESNFYELVDTLFKGHVWPKGKYIGYASVYLMFPRNLKEKTFYFPHAQTPIDPVSTIAHEMLHFIFFDYIQKKYGIKESDVLKGKNKRYVWQVSETFNTMIENWSPYKNIFSYNKKIRPYPGCEEMLACMSKQWRRNQCIETLLDGWLTESD